MSDQTEDRVTGGPAKEPAPIDSNLNRPHFGKPGQHQSSDMPSNSPSIGLHPGNLEHAEVCTEATKPFLKVAIDAFGTAHSAVEAIYLARKDVSMNQFAGEDEYWSHLGDLASRKQDAATKALDYASRTLTAAIAHTRTSLETPIRSAATRAMSAEIRAHAAKLSPSQRSSLLRNASRDTLDALLGAESFLSGMTENEQAVHLRLYHERFSQEIAFRLKAMEHALELVNTRGPLVFHEVEKAIGKSWTFVEVCRKRHAKMKAALAG